MDYDLDKGEWTEDFITIAEAMFKLFEKFLVVVLVVFLLPVASLAADITYDEVWPIQGNVAPAGEAYVVVRGTNNEVIVRNQLEYWIGKTPKEALSLKQGHWVGKSSTQPETVLTDGIRISKNIDDLDEEKITIILFSPKEIRVVDLQNNSSYRYVRTPEIREMNISPELKEELNKYCKTQNCGDAKPP